MTCSSRTRGLAKMKFLACFDLFLPSPTDDEDDDDDNKEKKNSTNSQFYLHHSCDGGEQQSEWRVGTVSQIHSVGGMKRRHALTSVQYWENGASAQSHKSTVSGEWNVGTVSKVHSIGGMERPHGLTSPQYWGNEDVTYNQSSVWTELGCFTQREEVGWSASLPPLNLQKKMTKACDL